MIIKDIKDKYTQTPWGKFLIKIGKNPYNTEPNVKEVAVYAASRIDTLERSIQTYKEHYEYLLYAMANLHTISGDPQTSRAIIDEQVKLQIATKLINSLCAEGRLDKLTKEQNILISQWDTEKL